MAWDIIFTPLISVTLLWGMAALASMLIMFSLWRKLPGAVFRACAVFVLLLILANPTILQEDRDPIKDVVALVIDQTASQDIGERKAVTDESVEQLKQTLSAMPDLEMRDMIVRSQPSSTRDLGTTLFETLNTGLSDIPTERIAGAIFVTDGQVHDVPLSKDALGFDAPVHVLLSGERNEKDRKLTIERAPRFGIVGENVALRLRVDDFGAEGESVLRRAARLIVRIDGDIATERRVLPGMSTNLEIEISHGGQNVIEIEVDPIANELTRQNNRAVVLVNGIRDHLRVLLVSGEPHAGERTWRNLLKADPSVDLVHFTILRPPEKQDGTPIGELSLIEFPTRELFSTKLNEFDLIIFDRYRRRGVLPPKYLENVARFVENGGALLTAAGPAFATPFSLYRSQLAFVLPARPTGDVVAKGYRPRVTETGFRHPITTDLPGANALPPPDADATDLSDPSWGRWFRLIDSKTVSGQTVMAGPNEEPLLILDRVGNGRVAQLMSDHAWLWARGYEGGGPQAELLRRLAHWLMKEPDLEEEDLRAVAEGDKILITRHTMADNAGSITVTSPSGKTQTLMPEQTGAGEWTAQAKADELGLYRINDIALATVAGVGPLNPKEFSDVRTSDESLKEIISETGGGVFWLNETRSITGNIAAPSIRHLTAGRTMAGRNWIGLKENNQYVVQSLNQTTIFTAAIALILLLGGLLLGWYREGR